MKNSFANWVAARGGPNKVGPLLGVTPHAVRHWLRGDSIPRPKTLNKILHFSRGRVKLLHVLALCTKK